jgi:hypothetical protein
MVLFKTLALGLVVNSCTLLDLGKERLVHSSTGEESSANVSIGEERLIQSSPEKKRLAQVSSNCKKNTSIQ